MEPESSSGLALRFRAGPFPVVVEPSFWLIMALFGWSSRPERVAAWVVICFFSILFHELGHALTNRAFGAEAWIRLYSFGGLCYADRIHGKWRDIAVSLAGPVAGFCVGGVVLLVARLHPTDNPFGRFCLLQATWVNFGWGVLNLLPVMPLDGGHVLASLMGPTRVKLVAWISFAVGGSAAVAGWMWLHDPYIALLMGWLGLQSLSPGERGARPRKARKLTREEKNGVALGWAALSKGDEVEATRLGRGALHAAQGPEALAAARDLLAWSAIAAGDPARALDHLRSIPPELERPLSWALAYESARLWDRALPHARRALDEEPSDASASALLRILVALTRRDEAERLFRRYAWSQPDRARLILNEAEHFPERASG